MVGINQLEKPAKTVDDILDEVVSKFVPGARMSTPAISTLPLTLSHCNQSTNTSLGKAPDFVVILPATSR